MIHTKLGQFLHNFHQRYYSFSILHSAFHCAYNMSLLLDNQWSGVVTSAVVVSNMRSLLEAQSVP